MRSTGAKCGLLFTLLAAVCALFILVIAYPRYRLSVEARAARRLAPGFFLSSGPPSQSLMGAWMRELGFHAPARSYVTQCAYGGRLREMSSIGPLADFQQLAALTLGNPGSEEDVTKVITDRFLAPLERLPAFESLAIWGRTSVTDAFLFRISQNGTLRILSLDSTWLTDAGISALGRCRNLTVLSLRNSQLRRGFANLSFNQLQALDISGAPLNSDDLRTLTHLTSLERLVLCGTAVDDQCFEVVNQLPHLNYLDLSATQVTDAGLQRLKNGAIRRLQANETSITPAGAERAGENCPLATFILGPRGSPTVVLRRELRPSPRVRR